MPGVKFQTTAPSRAANTTAGPKNCDSTVDPTVLATAVCRRRRKATQFQPAAQATAQRWLEHRVATDGWQMEFAASWNPLV